MEQLFPLLIKCRLDWRDGIIYLMTLKCSLNRSLILYWFFVALSVGLNDLLIFFFNEKHFSNLITCTFKIESENRKIICARDCYRKCYLNSRWLGGKQKNSSRKPGRKLEEKFKRQCRKWGREWELGFICGQKHLLTEMTAVQVNCVCTWKSI